MATVLSERAVPLLRTLVKSGSDVTTTTTTTAVGNKETSSSSPTAKKVLVPSSQLTFQDFLNTLPRDVFERSSRKAILTIVLSLFMITVGTVLTKYSPWFLLPANWLFIGIVSCGLFVVGYNCSQEAFFNSCNTPSWVNSTVGIISMMILLYPYESFKRMNEKRLLQKQQALQSKEKNETTASVNNNVDGEEGFTLYKLVSYLAASPFWFLASVWEWITTNVYFESNTSVVMNAVCLYAFAGLFFSLTIYFGGIWTLFKYYLGPLIMYHICMSTFLKVNEMSNVTEQGKQITSFPTILEFLTHCANHSYVIRVRWNDKKEKKGEEDSDDDNDEEELSTTLFNSMQEALSSLVPAYNLRKAKAALAKLEDIKTNSVQLSQLKDILTKDAKGEPIIDPSQIDWVITIYLWGSLLGSLYGFLFCTWYWKTWVLAFWGYQLAGLGITAGYHRLFSHKSYDAHWTVRYFLLALGTSSFQGPVLSWCSDHRVHHRYTDTNKDPYDITKGFWYAHWGWLFKKRDEQPHGVEDLQADPAIRFQYEYYKSLGFFSCYMVPCLIAGIFWGDWWGGFWIGGVLKTTFLQHCTFFINSLAHTWGDATFTAHRSARDSYVVSLFTFGEGYHNFHHEFPFDYRNGIRFFHYDPGKWLIAFFSYVGLAWDLKMFNPELFEKGRIQQIQRKIDNEKKAYNWGPDLNSLSVKTWDDYRRDVTENKKPLMLIDDIAHDLTDFADAHPGGKAFIDTYIGKDATDAFLGGVYNHSNAAKNLLATKRAYRVTGVPAKKAVNKVKAA